MLHLQRKDSQGQPGWGEGHRNRRHHTYQKHLLACASGLFSPFLLSCLGVEPQLRSFRGNVPGSAPQREDGNEALRDQGPCQSTVTLCVTINGQKKLQSAGGARCLHDLISLVCFYCFCSLKVLSPPWATPSIVEGVLLALS